MPKKFNNKYRIDSARLKNWDYRSNGAYFITICTANREHFFGEIIGNETSKEMNFSKVGMLAEKYWEQIPEHFPFVSLGNFVIMPNHMHGILIINNVVAVETLQCNVCSKEDGKNQFFSEISPKSGSISAIIRSYKSIVTRESRVIVPKFYWHSKFHDHIIRNSISFERIQNYIENNPNNWENDKLYRA
jgi:putative transposase